MIEYNIIVLSLATQANIPEFNWIKLNILLVCSLIVKSGLNVLLLYIMIERSLEPETNLPSFKTVEHLISDVWYFNMCIGSFNFISKLSKLL